MRQESNFGDFEEVKQEKPTEQSKEEPQIPQRVRMPNKDELIGVIIRRLGGNKMEVTATDGKTRNCRVPGRYKRRLWLRPKDIVLITPWELDNNRGDIIYKYRHSAINQLKKQGILDSLTQEF